MKNHLISKIPKTQEETTMKLCNGKAIDLNSLYNFKNPIRHFFNINAIAFDCSESCTFEDLAWTTPVKFKIFKTEDSQRTIGFPNILNFYHTVKKFQSEPNFFDIGAISLKKRVSPDLNTGEFSVLNYYRSIQSDAFNLTKYDKLLILDIKSFYGRIYTHDFGFSDGNYLEQRVTSLNSGRTNGLLLGSYLSLYLAEKFLLKIEKKLDEMLTEQHIDCHYEYFSDDFYFFCNQADKDRIIEGFAKVLDAYELQVNYDKTVVFDFEEYTKDNNLEKLWKKIILLSTEKDKAILEERDEASLWEQEVEEDDEEFYDEKIQNDTDAEEFRDHPAFFTQLVYRLSQISELKYKRIFLANFFKTFYFYNLNPDLYVLSQSDLNYICYIYKLMPETILYSLPTIMRMKGFNHSTFRDFVLARFNSVLHTDRQEEQVYFYYAIKLCGFDTELVCFKDKVLHSENQILISYFILDKIITEADYQNEISHPQEGKWLQNYHYILANDKTNIDMLLPTNAKKPRQRQSYYDFYHRNLESDIPIFYALFLRSIVRLRYFLLGKSKVTDLVR